MLVGIGVPSKYFTLPVEASESAAEVTLKRTAHAAHHEVAEHHHVPAAAQAQGEPEHGRRDPERDHVGQLVEVGAEHRLAAPIEERHVAVEHVEHECQG